MRTLTKEEKLDLKSLSEHRGFRVLKNIVADFELDVLRSLKKANLKNDEDLQKIHSRQNYLQGQEELMGYIDGQTKVAQSRKIK